MRSFITILVFLIGIIAIACSSNTLGPTEKDLEQRAQSFFEATINEKWSDLYDIFPGKFKESCSHDEFVEAGEETSTGMKEIRESFGIGDPKLEFHIVDILIEGTKGLVSVEIKLDGIVAAPASDDPEEMIGWIFIDGGWYLDEADLSDIDNCYDYF